MIKPLKPLELADDVTWEGCPRRCIRRYRPDRGQEFNCSENPTSSRVTKSSVTCNCTVRLDKLLQLSMRTRLLLPPRTTLVVANTSPAGLAKNTENGEMPTSSLATVNIAPEGAARSPTLLHGCQV